MKTNERRGCDISTNNEDKRKRGCDISSTMKTNEDEVVILVVQ